MKTDNWLEEEKGDIWWNQVSGPLAYMNEITSNVQQGISTVIKESDVDSLFFTILEDKIQQIDSAFVFETFKASDYANEIEFQNDLIARLAPKFVRKLTSPYKRLYSEGHLQHRFIYFEIDTDAPWVMNVMKEMCPLSSQGNGVFLCITRDTAPYEGIKHLKTLDISSYISIYNLQYFAMQCLGNFETRDSKGMYISQLAAKLSDVNGLVCANLAKHSLYSDTMDVCQGMDTGKVEKAVWETQIQIFLPIIEEIRRYLILRYTEKIQHLLPKKDEFGHEITDPTEMELRHLQYYGRKGDNTFFDFADDMWFKAAYNARNDLSHLKLLNRETMDTLFDIEYALKSQRI